MRRQDSSNDVVAEPFLEDKDNEVDIMSNLNMPAHQTDGSQEIRLYTSGLESAMKAAKTIIIFLTQRLYISTSSHCYLIQCFFRSGKGKATKNSNEAEYRTIFDNLISDLLAVLYWPEWPAACLLLSIVCKFMVCDCQSSRVSASERSSIGIVLG